MAGVLLQLLKVTQQCIILIEAREVNWRHRMGGGVGGHYNRNIRAGSVTNNNNLSAEDRKREQTEELFLKNPPPLRGGDGGSDEEYYSLGDDNDFDGLFDNSQPPPPQPHQQQRDGGEEWHFLPTAPNVASMGIPGQVAALGGGDTTGMNSKGKLPFNYRKFWYFDTITATESGNARKFLWGEINNARRARVMALLEHLKRAQLRERGEVEDKTMLSSDVRAGEVMLL